MNNKFYLASIILWITFIFRTFRFEFKLIIKLYLLFCFFEFLNCWFLRYYYCAPSYTYFLTLDVLIKIPLFLIDHRLSIIQFMVLNSESTNNAQFLICRRNTGFDGEII